MAEYQRCFDAAAIRATCEEFRAAATIDLIHDEADKEQKIESGKNQGRPGSLRARKAHPTGAVAVQGSSAPLVFFTLHYIRKRVETSLSQITARFARTLRAVTSRCFELKIGLSILAFAI